MYYMFADFFKSVKFPSFLVPLQNFFAFVSSRLFSFQIYINVYIYIYISLISCEKIKWTLRMLVKV